MTVAQQEIFGPVGAVIPFDDDEEAIRIANDSCFGLSGSLWTADTGTAFAMAQRINTGNISINGGTGGMSRWAPFGGYKRSGVGRELGADVLDDFTRDEGDSIPRRLSRRNHEERYAHQHSRKPSRFRAHR